MQELSRACACLHWAIPIWRPRWRLASSASLPCCVRLIPVTGQLKSVGSILWQLFGASNQLLAALALLVVSLYLRSLGRPTVYTLLPMGFMLVVTISALVLGMQGFWAQGNRLLFGFSGAIFAAGVVAGGGSGAGMAARRCRRAGRKFHGKRVIRHSATASARSPRWGKATRADKPPDHAEPCLCEAGFVLAHYRHTRFPRLHR
jgi:hypothetical protein